MSERTAPKKPGSDEARAVRVAVGLTSRLTETPPLTIAPPADRDLADALALPRVNGEPVEAALLPRDPHRAILAVADGSASTRHHVVLGPLEEGRDGVARREVLVDGWRIDVEIEPERRAALRERARRIGATSAHSGPLEVRAVIPGRIVAVNIAPGDVIDAGHQLLVIEAMKMQNEVRSPHAGTVSRIAVNPGAAIEVGDVLVVIE